MVYQGGKCLNVLSPGARLCFQGRGFASAKQRLLRIILPTRTRYRNCSREIEEGPFPSCTPQLFSRNVFLWDNTWNCCRSRVFLRGIITVVIQWTQVEGRRELCHLYSIALLERADVLTTDSRLHCKKPWNISCAARHIARGANRCYVQPKTWLKISLDLKKKKKKTVGAVVLSIVKRHAQCHSADIFCFVLFLSLHHIMIIIIHVIRRVLFVYWLQWWAPPIAECVEYRSESMSTHLFTRPTSEHPWNAQWFSSLRKGTLTILYNAGADDVMTFSVQRRPSHTHIH